MTNLEYFDAYARSGLRAIPLYPRSKVPVNKRWTTEWDRDRCRAAVEPFPDANLGLILGGIVDVEGDTPEANRMLELMTDGHAHPQYRSSKSVHHLFVNPDPDLTILKFAGMEFRARGHQSVLPPSTHEDGSKYVWLTGTVFPVPEMPPPLLSYYTQHRKVPKKPKLKPGHVRVWCTACGGREYIHKKRYDLEKIAFGVLGVKWECHKCRVDDVRASCREIRKAGLVS